MMIGIIGAMEQEIALLRDRIDNYILWQQAGCKIYTGQLHCAKIALVKSGIGKVSAALGTTLLLSHFKPDLVINTGSAGGLLPSLTIGDIVVSDEVRYHDVDVTDFGYELGQMAKCPAAFNAAPSLLALTKKIINRFNINAVVGLVVSGDTFINKFNELDRIRNLFPHAIAVDMESTAIAHVCHHFSVPFVVVRAISDVVNSGSILNFKSFLEIAVQNSSRIVAEIIKSIARSN